MATLLRLVYAIKESSDETRYLLKTQPRYSKEEFARRGDEIYERVLRPVLETGNEGRFVAIDIETVAYAIDADELAASDLSLIDSFALWQCLFTVTRPA